MLNVKELASGTLLGHYKIVRRLGQGGMGVVYEAVDQKLGRHVAVKLLAETISENGAALASAVGWYFHLCRAARDCVDHRSRPSHLWPH